MEQSTKKCPQCQTDIPVLAKVCPQCRSVLSKPTSMLTKIFLGVIGLGVLSSIILSHIDGSSTSTPVATPSPEEVARREAVEDADLEAAYKSVKAMADDGFLYKIEPEQYRAYVNEVKWANTTIDQKEAYALQMGLYIQNQNGDTLGIDILGARSGAKLGEWNDQNGLNISE